MTDPKHEALMRLMLEMHRELGECFKATIKDIDLPPTTVMIIRMIYEHPGMTVSELARRCGTVKSHVSKVVDDLSREGMLEKRSDPDDQRLQRVYATAAAERRHQEIRARFAALWADIAAVIPPDEVPPMLDSLTVLVSAIQQVRKGRSSS